MRGKRVEYDSPVFSLKNGINECFPQNPFVCLIFRANCSSDLQCCFHFLTSYLFYSYLLSAYYHSTELLLIMSPMATMFLNPLDTFPSSFHLITLLHLVQVSTDLLKYFLPFTFLIFCYLSGCSFELSFSGFSSTYY